MDWTGSNSKISAVEGEGEKMNRHLGMGCRSDDTKRGGKSEATASADVMFLQSPQCTVWSCDGDPKGRVGGIWALNYGSKSLQ